jgi:hypothetical protein
MVDEEGFSPIEMARVISEKVSGNTGISEEEHLAAEDVISRQSFAQASKHQPASILKRQHSSASEVKFDIQNASDAQAEDSENLFRNHGVSSQDDPGMFKTNVRMNRPSTSNFFEVRSELNSGRYSLMDSDEGSMNVDTHTNDEVMRKM